LGGGGGGQTEGFRGGKLVTLRSRGSQNFKGRGTVGQKKKKDNALNGGGEGCVCRIYFISYLLRSCATREGKFLSKVEAFGILGGHSR